MSACVTPTNQLKLFWDNFFHSETGTYEKSTWLDLFLAEYLIQLRNGGEPHTLLSFCPIGGIVTLVGCELLCGVHCVTSSSCSQFVHLAKNDYSRECASHLPPYHDNSKNDFTALPSSSTQNISNTQNNITTSQALKKFLLKGSAWRCLALLQSLGVEGLSCSRQLSGVLVWLYGELSGTGGICHGPNIYLPQQMEKPPIYNLFSNKIWTRRSLSNDVILSRNGGTNVNKLGNKLSRNRRKSHIKRDSQENIRPRSGARKAHSQVANKNQTAKGSSDSEDNNEELQILNRSFALKVKPKINDFDYYSAIVNSEDDATNVPLYSPLRNNHQRRPLINDFISDKHRAILNSEISQYEFCDMAIGLLYQLCKAEMNTNDSEALHISVQCINFALKHLCTLQFESSPASHVNLTSSEATHLKTSLTELLMLSFDKVLMHSELFNKIISNGILPMLLHILEDAIYKLQVRLRKPDDKDEDDFSIQTNQYPIIDKNEASDWAKYLFGISYSILVFLYSLLMQNNSLSKIHEFVEQFKLFGDCRQGFIIRDSISLMMRIPEVEQQIKSTYVKNILISINRLINTLKSVRSDLIHLASCSRSKHKSCQPKMLLLMHHHHDILGTSFSHTGYMGLSSVCSVSTLYATLASLLSDDIFIQSSVLRAKLLKCMRHCGTCCCFSPQFLLDKVVKIIKNHNVLANMCYLILEQTLYGEIGVMNNPDANVCSFCNDYYSIQSTEAEKIYKSTSIAAKDSSSRTPLKHSLSENDGIGNVGNVVEYRVTWPFLSKYITLLQSSNIPLLHSTMNHLLKMSIHCKQFVKHDLLFCVLYPAFVMAKSRYLLTNNDYSYFVTTSCLNAFANLLGISVFARQFIQEGGLNDILDLIALPEFSKQCCSILEISTITEIFMTKNELNKLYCNTVKITTIPFEELDKLPSIIMLIKSLDSLTRKTFNYFKLKVGQTCYDEIMTYPRDEKCPFLYDIDENTEPKEQGVTKSASTSGSSYQRNIEGPHKSQTAAIYEMQYSTTEQTMSHHIEMLKTVWVFWKTCCGLCLYSPVLRKYFVKKKVLHDSFKMFKFLLHCVLQVPCTQNERKILMKILEVFVTIYVSVSDFTMKKSMLVVIELLQKKLLTGKIESLDVNNVKLLCDMLLRVSSTQPSNVEVMPPKNKIKLPPLQYPKNNGDEESSSGEENDGGIQRKSCTSEGSESYHSADEGYEADVEVCVVDSLSADVDFEQVFINNSNSGSAVRHSVHSIVNNSGLAEIGCSDYKKVNVVTYPELCRIVLDVVLTLIDRIIEEQGAANSINDSDKFNVANSCLSKMSNLFFHDASGLPVTGFISQILLSPSVGLLKRKDDYFKDLQRSLLKLICTLGSKSITPKELKLYFKLFNNPDVPLSILLEPLQRLADTVHSNVPDFIVCFPVDASSPAVISRPGQHIPHATLSKDLNSSQIEAYALFLHQEHGKAGIRSCWSKMGMWCPIDGVNWGLWLEGCSITMWMMLRDMQTHPRTQSKTSFCTSSDDSYDEGEQMEKQSSKTAGSLTSQRSRKNIVLGGDEQLNIHSDSETDILNILHLLSIGHDSVMIEFWVNVVNGDILIQLTRPANDCNNIIGEGVLKNCINVRCWNHITINIKEVTHKKTLCIEVKVYVNGVESLTYVPLTGVLLHRIRPAFLVIGHSTPSDLSPASRPRGSWFLSNLAVFRTPILNKYTAMYLMAHGPDIKPLTTCHVGNQVPNFGLLFSPNVVGTNIDWDQVLDISSSSITQMQENLLLTYSAHNPNSMDIYHQTVSHQSVFRKSSNIKSGPVSIPVPKNVFWMGRCLSSQHSGFAPSLYLIGGPNILLYLYARVVELENDSEVQSAALSTLFKISLSDARLHSMFQQDDILNMLHIVFSSEQCKVDHFLLKALLDAACDKSILVKNNNKFHFMMRVNVILKYPEVLVTAIKAWRQFEGASKKLKENRVSIKKALSNDIDEALLKDTLRSSDEEDEVDKTVEFITEENGLLGVLFQCINIMLRDENPYRQFNVYQLNRFNMVEALLMFCKERFLYSDFGQLSEVVSYGLVELIRSLMGSPPPMHHIALITEFLVLMHECSQTYITHARSTIYFLLTEVTVKSREKCSFELNGMSSEQAIALGLLERPSSTPEFKYTVASGELVKENQAVNAGNEEMPSTSTAFRIDPSLLEGCPPDPTSTDSPSTNPSKTMKKTHESHLSEPIDAQPTSGIAESTSAGGSLELTKDYDVVGSDEIKPEKTGPLMIYQKLRSPVLLRNLRTCATRSWTTCEGLLLLLRDTVTIMPDTYLPQMLGIVLRTEMLLVLANHPEAAVRSAVVKVISAVLQRCSPEEIKRFHERNYFHNLANQISQKDASYELVSACASLITGHRASVEDQLEDDAWIDVRDKQLSMSPPLIAVLTPSLHDVSLAHNTSLMFKKIISLTSVKMIASLGMMESIVKCLRHIGSILDVNFDGRDLLLSDMRELLSLILLKILLTDRNSHLYSDLFNALVFLDMMERKRSKKHLDKCHVLTTMRDTYCFLLQEELNFFQELLVKAFEKKIGKRPSVISTESDQDGSDSGPNIRGMSRSAPTGAGHPRSAISPPRILVARIEDPKNEYSRSDLKDKVVALLKRATGFFSNREWNLKISKYEITTVEIIFLLIVSICSGANSHFRVKWWKKLVNNDCHSIMSDLFMWMISPKQEYTLRKFAVQTVYEAWPTVKKVLTPTDPRKQRKQAVYLNAMMRDLTQGEEEVDNVTIESLKEFVASWATALEPQRLESESLEGEVKHLVDKDDEKRENTLTLNYDQLLKSVLGKEALVNSIIDSAMSGTQSVVEYHNKETKVLMDQIKKQDSIYVASCHKWQRLLDVFGHEQGVWFSEESHPRSWELDPSEGPSKVRIRLRRCHIDINEKFLKKDNKYKIDLAKKPLPLSYLFTWSMQSDYLDCLHMNEVISYMAPAVYVTVKSEQEGEVVLSDRCIHFFSDDKKDMTNISGIYLSLDDITLIHKRRWRLAETAVEVTLVSGRTHFIAFKEAKDMESFLKILESNQMPLRQNAEPLTVCANLWRNGDITNWEYLMHLNTLAGRTYNDLMQYPVFPFILADYTSNKLDLNKAASYRNLKKPVAVQDPNNERNYIENYNNLKEKNEERKRENPSNSGGFTDEPFHYGSHYSNSATVLHFLVRLPPFTKQFINFQDGNFDMPDRTFHSVNTAWRLAGCVSQSSCKELTPEFFYQPRIFTNDEGFEFGIRQCGIEVNHVELPKWCKDPRIFVLVHRQALESPHVRENIPHWIDLIFGYKQTGEAAIEAINVFHPSTYHGYRPTLADSVQRDALDAMIRTYGQTPRQLLKMPHPQCITNLLHVPETVVEVLPTVSGLRWGYYCGSPQQSIPWMVWIKKPKPTTEKLIPLATGEVIGLPSQATVMVIYSKSTAMFHSGSNTSISAIAAITWGHTDGIIRIKQKKDVPPEPLFQIQDLDQVTVVSHGVGSTMGGLWFGMQSGRIIVLQPTPSYATPPVISFSRKPSYLFAHNAPIMAINISTGFGVAVSTCIEGQMIVWDLHNLTLVRVLSTCDKPITLVCLSDTLCDVCAVYDIAEPTLAKESPKKTSANQKNNTVGFFDPNIPGTSSSLQNAEFRTQLVSTKKRPSVSDNEVISYKTKLRVQTINGNLVAEVNVPERVTSVCYSNAPEGISVNALVVGLESGGVALYSSWDLTNLNSLMMLSFSGPLTSICYSFDAHYLYMVGYDGTIMVWESDSIRGKTPGFRQLSSLPIY